MREGDRILLVDDEPDIHELVRLHLEEAGFEVKAVGTGQEAIDVAIAFRPVVVILDLMLPDIPGPEVCRRLRAHPDLAGIAVLMLTARSDEYDRLLGFEVGADDYVTKPFSVREVVHRVRALSRRFAVSQSRPPEELSWRGLSLDPTRHHATINNEELPLRPLEFRLLQAFLERPGKVLTRAELLSIAWDITATLHTRTVDTHVRRLREALGEYGDAIETVVGFGYRLREEQP